MNIIPRTASRVTVRDRARALSGSSASRLLFPSKALKRFPSDFPVSEDPPVLAPHAELPTSYMWIQLPFFFSISDATTSLKLLPPQSHVTSL